MPDTTAALLSRDQIVNSVLIGRDGFLFTFQHGINEMICGRRALDPHELSLWTSLIEARTAWCRSMGIVHLTIIVPEKQSVYGDKLPQAYRPSLARPVLQVHQALQPFARARYINMTPILRRERATEDTFHRTDVHPTPYGSYLCYRELVSRMRGIPGPPPLPVAELQRRQVRKLGDLGIRLDTEPVEDVTGIAHPRTRAVRKVFTNRGWGPGQVEVFENDDRTLPSCVLMRDSNATTLIPFLGTHFSRLVAIATQTFFYDLIREERPAVVISQLAERLVGRRHIGGETHGTLDLPPDFGPEGFFDATGVALPLPQFTALVIGFGEGGNSARYLREGWALSEREHTWTLGDQSVIEIPAGTLQRQEPLEIELDAFGAMMNGRTEPHRLQISAGGIEIGSFVLSKLTTKHCTIPPEAVAPDGALRLALFHPDHIAPGGQGDRQISLGVMRLRLRRAAAK